MVTTHNSSLSFSVSTRCPNTKSFGNDVHISLFLLEHTEAAGFGTQYTAVHISYPYACYCGAYIKYSIMYVLVYYNKPLINEHVILMHCRFKFTRFSFLLRGHVKSIISIFKTTLVFAACSRTKKLL